MRLSRVLVVTGGIWFACSFGIALLMPDEDRQFIGHVAFVGWFIVVVGIVIHMFSVGLLSLKIIGSGFGVAAVIGGMELFLGETPLLEELMDLGTFVIGVGILIGMFDVAGKN